MLRKLFNNDWTIAPNTSIETLMNPGKAVKVTLPYDDMPNHKRFKDAPSQNHTGYFPDVVLTIVKNSQSQRLGPAK